MLAPHGLAGKQGISTTHSFFYELFFYLNQFYIDVLEIDYVNARVKRVDWPHQRS